LDGAVNFHFMSSTPPWRGHPLPCPLAYNSQGLPPSMGERLFLLAAKNNSWLRASSSFLGGPSLPCSHKRICLQASFLPLVNRDDHFSQKFFQLSESEKSRLPPISQVSSGGK